MTPISVLRFTFAVVVFACLQIVLVDQTCFGQRSLDDPPIRYRESTGSNRVTEMMQKLRSGELSLPTQQGFGNLYAVLDYLEIPVSSQVLVFSKTSLQSRRISPSNPRAIFFNDDIHVGWVRGSSLLEISTADPDLGAVFYTMGMGRSRPALRRENSICLGCHEKTRDGEKVTEHMVRSVMARSSGTPNLLLKAFNTDHSSPIPERWGGWYVTGRIQGVSHMGNAFLQDETLVPIAAPDQFDLTEQINTSTWPTPHSDIVALMVLEHQTDMLNRFTRANFAARRALHAAGNQPEAANEAIGRAARLVVDGLLFVDEAPIDGRLEKSNSFADDFMARGTFTRDGKSLRVLDLETRLFRYPCSYLIGSDAFDGLNETLRAEIIKQLSAILQSKTPLQGYQHLSQTDRQGILSILRETKPELISN